MIDLFTVLWGDEMTAGYLDVVLPSLLQWGNIPQAHELIHEYGLYTDEITREKITNHKLYPYLTKHVHVRWEDLKTGINEVNSNLKHQLRLSADEKHYVKILSPDCIVGNESLFNIAKLADGTNNPILYGGFRVIRAGWNHLSQVLNTQGFISNKQVVGIGMQYISEVSYPLQEVDGHWLVSHHCPTPCVLPDKWVVDTFAANDTLNNGFDHSLPYMMVERGYPWHFIKHSNTYIQAERGRHLLSEAVGQLSGWRDEKHLAGCKFFGQLQQIWEGEND